MLYAHEVAQVRIIQLACLIDYVIRSRRGSSENYHNLHVWLIMSHLTLTKWLKWELYYLHVWLIMLCGSRSGSSENYTTCMFDWLCYTLTKWLKWELYKLTCLIDYVIRSRSGSSENYINLHVWLIMLYAHEVAQVRIIELACLIDYVIRSRSGSSENYRTCMFDWLCYTLTKWLKWE